MAAPTKAIAKTVVSALDGAMHGVEVVGATLESLMRPSRWRWGGEGDVPGSPAGIEHMQAQMRPPEPGSVILERVDYSAQTIQTASAEWSETALEVPRPEGTAVRWWDVRGLHPWVVDRFRDEIGFHTLTAEDVLHVPQRPRAEVHDDHIYVVAKLLVLENERVKGEQVSIFLLQDTMVSFQEDPDDSFTVLRHRAERDGSRLRSSGPDFLLYALLDTIVDHWFPVLEHYRDLLEDLEDEVLGGSQLPSLGRIHQVKRELAVLRRVVWPTRKLVEDLTNVDSPLMSEATRLYLNDVHGHAAQAADILETLRELASSLIDLYMSAASHRTNETMRVLTVIASLFIPITFLAGVYGMNFEYMPELRQPWAYPLFWILCGVTTVLLLAFFRRKGWLGG